jgi:hypothetical protein
MISNSVLAVLKDSFGSRKSRMALIGAVEHAMRCLPSVARKTESEQSLISSQSFTRIIEGKATQDR